MSVFSGLISRWKKPCLCMKAIACIIWNMMLRILGSGNVRPRWSEAEAKKYRQTRERHHYAEVTRAVWKRRHDPLLGSKGKRHKYIHTISKKPVK